MEIRCALLARLERRWSPLPNTLIVQELGTHYGEFRVDLAVINGALRGYEIKSGADRLDRLPRQMSAFNEVFDYVTLVAATKHLDRCLEHVPTWWGIIEVLSLQTSFCLKERRRAARNMTVNAQTVARLLWRQELLELLRTLGIDAGIGAASRDVLAARLASSLPPSEISRLVRERIRERHGWRDGQERKQYAGKSLPGHMSSGFLARRIRPPRPQGSGLLG